MLKSAESHNGTSQYTHTATHIQLHIHRSSEHPVYGLEKVNHSTYTHTHKERERERYGGEQAVLSIGSSVRSGIPARRMRVLANELRRNPYELFRMTLTLHTTLLTIPTVRDEMHFSTFWSNANTYLRKSIPKNTYFKNKEKGIQLLTRN